MTKIPTSLKSLHQDLEDLQRYVEDLTVFLPLPFCTVNPFDIVLGINQAFQELTGYGEMEMIGNTIDILFLEKNKIKDFKKKIPKERERISAEMTLVTKEKKKIPVDICAKARRDQKDNFLGYFLTISDISEAKRFQEKLEQEVIQRTQELQQKVRELERFQRLTVGRELKMVELKKEIDRLKDLKEKE